MVHTIVLIQTTTSPKDKIYADFQTITSACRYICDMYEAYLCNRASTLEPTLTYDMSELYDYIDRLLDLNILVDRFGGYELYGKGWIKTKIYHYLRNEVTE